MYEEGLLSSFSNCEYLISGFAKDSITNLHKLSEKKGGNEFLKKMISILFFY